MANHTNYCNIKNSSLIEVEGLEKTEELIRAGVNIGTIDYLWFNNREELKSFRNRLEAESKRAIDNINRFLEDMED